MNRIETFFVFQQRVAEWSNARGLLEGTTIEKQTLKFCEEAGELAKAVMIENEADIIDSLGDCLVVAANICEKAGWSLADCANQAWDEIKDRKGSLKNGTFVKDGGK